MKNKKGAAVLLCVTLLLPIVCGCGESFSAPKPGKDEIMLKIKLDLDEDIGLLLIDYVIDGHKGGGGISNADKTPVARNETQYWSFEKNELGIENAGVSLTFRLSVVTKYFDPNYDNIYPEEYVIPAEELTFDAVFGRAYSVTLSGGKNTGYTAALTDG